MNGERGGTCTQPQIQRLGKISKGTLHEQIEREQKSNKVQGTASRLVWNKRFLIENSNG